MAQPIEKYLFRQVEGVWRNVLGESRTLADVLNNLEIIIDDETIFARIRQYDKNREIWYRAYNQAKITIDIWKQD